MWLFIIFIVVLIVSLVVLPSQLFSWLRVSRNVVQRKDLRTGDILYTSVTGAGNYLFSFAGIQGSHALLVVKDDTTGEVNVLEISGYRDNPSAEAKPCIRPLSDRLQYDDYDSFVSVWKYKGPHIPSSHVHDFLETVKDCSFNYKFIGEHIKQRFLGHKRDLTRDKLCCSELVYLALVYLGVLQFNEYDFSDSFRYLMQLPTHENAADYMDVV